jgi:hypothetical protein
MENRGKIMVEWREKRRQKVYEFLKQNTLEHQVCSKDLFQEYLEQNNLTSRVTYSTFCRLMADYFKNKNNIIITKIGGIYYYKKNNVWRW